MSAALVIALTGVTQPGDDSLSFPEAAWLSLMRTLDPGTMGGDTGWQFRVVMLMVTLCGVFLVSALIGILNNGLESKLADLRKGRSQVIESNHTVILGWSRQVFAILSELATAYAHRKRPCVVILGDHDRVAMEEAILDNLRGLSGIKIVCRNGQSTDPNDLHLTSINAARSIIILSPDDADEPDAWVIKTLLAITNNSQRRPEPYHLVAEIRNPRNLDVARLAGNGEAELVLTGDLVARIIAQTCRQTGLSLVYTELLDFGGDEIYCAQEPRLAGRTFGEALLAFSTCSVIGVRTAHGQPRLTPPMDTRLNADDELIIISQDETTIAPSYIDKYELQEQAIVDHAPAQPQAERTLMLGWNWRGSLILEELDKYVPKGSETLVVADVPEVASKLERLKTEQTNQSITFLLGDTSDRSLLDRLNVEGFHHIIVIAYSDSMDAQRCDAKTLATLLHLRDIADKIDAHFSIVSEMLDARNRKLADITRADDFIISEQLISLLLTQIAENKMLNAVFQDIFDADGSEIYMKPATSYVKPGASVSFFTIVESARRQGQIAIGYRRSGYRTDGEVVLNPDKSKMVNLTDKDFVIVVSED